GEHVQAPRRPRRARSRSRWHRTPRRRAIAPDTSCRRVSLESTAVARPRVHSDADILDAARTLVLDAGARAVTIDAIALASGAPKGSLYHRFASLNDLLAEMWIRAARRAQEEFLRALDQPDAIAAAVAGACSLYDFAHSN